MRILWVKTELLHPVDKGGRIRTYNMLRELKRRHHVTYITLDDGSAAPDAVERASEYCHELVRVPFETASRRSPKFFAELAMNVVSPLPYAVAKYRSAEMRRVIERLGPNDADVLVCDFLFPSINCPTSERLPSVLFQHNVEAVIWERHTQVARNAVARAYMGEQWRRMQRHERAECRRFDHVVAVSEQDAAAFRDQYDVRNVSAVATGVDTEYFRSAGTAQRRPHELVFTGSMDWMPNEDAILYFCDAILPLIQREIPDVHLTVVGRHPPPRIVALGGSNAAVTVTGSVPDVRPYIEQAAVFIVPMRVGGGTRLKIYEAMGMERPVVSTTVGAEGLPLTSGEDAIIADEPADFARQVVALLRDPAAVDRIGQAGAALVRARFGWDRVAEDFAATCAAVAAGDKTGRTYAEVAASSPAPAASA